jgi:hypothetical protein
MTQDINSTLGNHPQMPGLKPWLSIVAARS